MQSSNITHSLQDLLLQSGLDTTESRYLILLCFLAKNNPLRLSKIKNKSHLSKDPRSYLMRFQEIFGLEFLNEKQLADCTQTQHTQEIWKSTPECASSDFFTIAENIFEHISNAHIQKKTGSFYTPAKVVELILNLDTARLSANHSRKILDPSCCLLYTSPSPRDKRQSRMPSSA